jgi:hypothetical protein
MASKAEVRKAGFRLDKPVEEEGEGKKGFH